MMKAVQLRVLGGAFGRVSSEATAFGHRDSGLFINVAAMYADPGETETHDAWVNGLAESLGNWERLRELKRRYDPDNLFRLNHNIPPAD